MDQAPPPTNAARVVRILHGALVAGMVLVGVTLVLVRRIPQRESFASAPTIGLALTGAGFILLAGAMLFLRSNIPKRGADQSADAYWMASEARGAAIVLWSVVEAGGLMALVGYLLTGAAAPVAIAALAVLVQILCRPPRLEGDGAA